MASSEQNHAHPAERIPRFTSVDEEAAFWETHSVADFAAEMTVATDVQFEKAQPKGEVTVRLEPETLAALTEQSKMLGMGPSTLVQLWILERLRRTPSEHPS